MAIRSTARTRWNGDLTSGHGQTTFASSGIGSFPVNWKARSEGSDSVTTPEELLAAAHASCFAMALSNALGEAGSPPTILDVESTVTFQPGTGVLGSELTVVGLIPGLSEADFVAFAEDAKANCPISQALSIPISLDARLS